MNGSNGRSSMQSANVDEWYLYHQITASRLQAAEEQPALSRIISTSRGTVTALALKLHNFSFQNVLHCASCLGLSSEHGRLGIDVPLVCM